MGSARPVARFTSKKRELMRAVWRLGVLALAAGLALAPEAALAQDTATQAPASDTPATDAVGPRDLQNFSLNGTVTRSADPVAVPRGATRQPAPAPRAEPPQAAAASSAPATPSRSVERAATRTADPQPDAAPSPAPVKTPARQAAPSIASSLPAFGDSPVSTNAAPSELPPADTLAPEHKLLLWPWLLAALMLGAGGAFLFWRNRSREAFAGGPRFDAFVAPDATPAPRPASPKAAPAAPSPGIVSTRLRPWIEIGFRPGRCIIEKDKVTFEFELGLQNSGSAPARAVLAEASLMNAGPYQDDEISAFYGSPVGEGERIAVIPPLKTVWVNTKVVAPRANVQLIEIAGRQVFVPLIAFNALYNWGTGEGQTSASYLLGRDTKGEKLAPFRLDLGPRIVRSVAGRALPLIVRK
jgi:hypothetical protein